MNSAAQEKLNQFFSKFKPLKYKKRDTILHADDYVNSVFYIKSGYVRAYKISEDGEELTLIILKPHDFFPFFWSTSSTRSQYYLEALTYLEVWRAPQEQFMEFATNEPEVFHNLTATVQDRFEGLLARMEYLVFGNAYRKVAVTLLICAQRFGKRVGKDVVVEIPLTHKDFAALVGITRETTCLEMKKIEKKGLISHRGRLVVVKDMDGLKRELMLPENTNSLFYNSL